MLIKRPQIVFISGHPGSGRTTLANNLSEKLNWPVLSVGQVMHGLSRSTDLSLEKMLVAATDVVLAQVDQAGMNNSRVIVDLSTNIKNEWSRIDALKDLWPRIKILPLFLISDFDVCEAQIEKRVAGTPTDLRTGFDRSKLAAEFEGYSDFDFRGLQKMEARRSKDDIMKNAVALIYANILN